MSEVYDISLFKPNKWNYNLLTDDEFNQLVSDLKNNIMVDKIIVRRKGDAYEIIDGEFRIKALKSLGIKTVPSVNVVIVDFTDADVRKYLRSKRIRGSRKNLIKESSVMLEDYQASGLSLTEYANKLGMDKGGLSRILSRCNIPLPAQELVIRSDVSPSVLDEIISVRPDYCTNVIQRAIEERWTVDDARTNVKLGTTIDGQPIKRTDDKRSESDLSRIDYYDRVALTKFLEPCVNTLATMMRYCKQLNANITQGELERIIKSITKTKNRIEGVKVMYPYTKGDIKRSNDLTNWLSSGTDDERKQKIVIVEERIRKIGEAK